MAKTTGGATGLWQGKAGGFNYKIVNGKQVVTEFVIPHNPQTARQMEVRSINTELSRAYRDDLNQGQRIAWGQRAETLGTKPELLFIKQNFPLLDFGLPTQLTPPALIMPPEPTDIIPSLLPESFNLSVPQMTPGLITAQTPFLDIECAGGFTEAIFSQNGGYNLEIKTEALSQGRVHQNSDFRHVIYVADKPVSEPVDEGAILVTIPFTTIRNIVLRIRRYNKFGNVSGTLIFNNIVDTNL